MKQRLLFAVLFVFLGTAVNAQFDPERFAKLKVKKKTCVALNKEAGEAAAYLLSKPAKPMRDDRYIAGEFLVKWMEKHPEMEFTLGDFYAKAVKNNGALNPIFVACLVQVKLENIGTEITDDDIDIKTAEKLVEYARVKKNKVYVNRYLKYMIKAKDKGELEEYIKA